MFYCVDKTTGKRTSLQTTNADEAQQIVRAKNQAERQPVLNLQIAKAYLAGTDNGIATRTWQQALASLTSTKPAASGWMLLFILLYIGCFGLSVGPVTWVILAEIFPTAVRGRALGLATFFLWTADYAVTQTFPMHFVSDVSDSFGIGLDLLAAVRRAGTEAQRSADVLFPEPQWLTCPVPQQRSNTVINAGAVC